MHQDPRQPQTVFQQPSYQQQPQTGARRFNEPAKFIPLMFMCVTILCLYLIYVLTHCLLLLQLETKPSHVDEEMRRRGLWQISVFHYIFVLLVICYARCVMTSPGEIPDNDQRWIYIDPTEPQFQDTNQLNLQELKRSGQRRHCKWCSKYKPDRCHHCRVCRTCILKMDHHCPWIYNCVGFGNYKYFFLLIMYTVIATQLIWTTMLESAMRSVEENAPFMTCFLHVFGVTLAFSWAVVLTLFWSFHVWLMFKAMTIIEFCEKSSQPKKGQDPSQRQASGYSSIYDKGCWGNIKAVLGNNPLLFFLPVNPPEGDGLTYLDDSTPLGGGQPSYNGQYQPPPYQQPNQGYAPQQPYPQGQYGGGYQQPGSQQYAQQQQQQYAQQQQYQRGGMQFA